MTSSVQIRAFIRNLFVALVVGFFSAAYGAVEFADIEQPTIEYRNGQKTLLVPEKFQQFINGQFPGFRIPQQSDLKTIWAEGLFPFIQWGDFNGDALTDVAAIILGEQNFKILIAHKTPIGYELGLMIAERAFDPPEKLGGISSPRGISLIGIPKGQEHVYGTEDPIARGSLRFNHSLDSVGVVVEERELSIFFWKDGGYEVIDLGE